MRQKIGTAIIRTSAFLLIIIGVVGLFLPFLQGILLILVGFYLLSLVSPRCLGVINRFALHHPKSRSLIATLERPGLWLKRIFNLPIVIIETGSKGDLIVGKRRIGLYRKISSILRFDRIYKKAIAELPVTASQSLLDLGCGAGDFLSMLHKVYPGVSLSGVDPSADMIEFARKQLPDTIGLTVAYAQATGLPSEKYDWIVSILALHHIPPQEKTAAIRELSRILRPNGQVLIVDFGRPVNFLGGLGSFLYLFHSYTKDNMVDVKRLLLTEGFSIRPSGHQYGFIEHLFAQKAGNPVSKPPEGIF